MYRKPAPQMMCLTVVSRVLTLIAILLSVATLPCWAELGGTVDSISADQEHMKGSRRVTAAQGYTLHEIQAGSGTAVREFVSPEGTVFAVAWQGPFTPDLHKLLGSYYDQYAQAIQAKRARRAPLIVHEPGLVIESGGHMRSSYGRVYVPELTPPESVWRRLKAQTYEELERERVRPHKNSE